MKAKLKTALKAVFFICVEFHFFTARKSANIHPTIVHPNKIDAHRTRILSYLSQPLTAARYAGANIMHNSTNIAAACFTRIKISGFNNIYIPYFAFVPSSSSIRINWMYFAILSVLDIDPVLIWPAFVATARSAIVVSSVSPLR